MLKSKMKTRITVAVIRSCRCTVLIGLSGFLWSCGTGVVPTTGSLDDVALAEAGAESPGPVADSISAESSVNVVISDQVKPSQADVPGYRGGPARTIGAAVGPNGELDEYVQHEVVFQPTDQADLDEFVTRYAGEVLDDGVPTKTPEGIDIANAAMAQASGYYLIRVDLSRSTLDDLEENLARAGVEGEMVFSSEESARLAALVLREQPKKVTPNLLVSETSILEHTNGGSGNIDWAQWEWMTEDDSSITDGDQGLSVGVVHAWDYMRYHDFPPSVWEPPYIAVIDRGFALDTQTGKPLNGNLDYFAFGDGVPWQWDFAGNDNRAGGNSGSWHGTGSFGVCCALPRNLYGSAGTGGEFVRPMLMKVGATSFSLADGIRFSGIWGADVITISLGHGAGVISSVSGADDSLQNAVYTAIAFGATVIAAAGNGNNHDISFEDILPCTLDKVICVGSVSPSGNNVFNYGSNVDIWAPTDIYSTVTPDTAGNVGVDELRLFRGTSASAPFVAGIVGLMKAIQPDLRWNEIQAILQNTANPSSDPNVVHGYVDAFRAVEALLPENQPPTVTIITPADGETVSYRTPRLKAIATDPEPRARVEDLVVTFSLEADPPRDCDATIRYENNEPYFACEPNYYPRYEGTQVIRVTATDLGGGVATDTITVQVVNTPPTIQLVRPTDGATFFEHQSITFGVYASDPDQFPFPQDAVSWESDLDGPLGTGWSVATTLSPGIHTVTATAEDERGALTQTSLTVNVLSGAGIPEATILTPIDGVRVFPGAIVSFSATATDPEEGPLSGPSLEWYSDRDGFLGTGTDLSVALSGPATACNPEFVTHTITLRVTDGSGNVIEYRIKVRVGTVC